jgi:hypothetical protein
MAAPFQGRQLFIEFSYIWQNEKASVTGGGSGFL